MQTGRHPGVNHCTSLRALVCAYELRGRVIYRSSLTITGSADSHDPLQASITSGDRTPTQQVFSPAQDPTRPELRSSASSIRRNVLSPEPTNSGSKLKKPGLSRRASSRYQAPHKGQEFSVDDDPEEYESDFIQRHPSVAKVASGVGPGLKRQASTLRRRQTIQPSILPRVDSQDEEDGLPQLPKSAPITSALNEEQGEETPGEEATVQNDADAEDGEEELSDTESFTLRDRQNAINETHPFGIRIWKPALYKKNRSVEKTAEGDIHSSPGGRVDRWLWTFNILWTLFFGWWLAIAAALGSLTCFALGLAPGAADYGRVLWGLAGYLLYPFGQFVKLAQDDAYAEEDEGEGRSITEYEQWQSGDIEDGRLFFGPLTSRTLIGRRRDSIESADENDSLLGHARTGRQTEADGPRSKRRLFGRGQWTFGRVIYFVFFYFLIAPLLLLVSGICWFMVFWIPMGKVTLLLFYHLRRHPLALSFHSDAAYSRGPSSASSSVLLCTYRAVGLKYWKYTIDGTNIFLINLIGVVLFVIFDYWVLGVAMDLKIWLVHPGFVFALALFSIIPLAYFIGQAVASISAQSSMGMGAAINAFFSTIVEVFLYCVALNQGKAQLVEGSIIGSIFAGILFLPGISMCFGAIQRKTQRFNVKSAGVTSTMLLFAVIAAFGPTLFYQIYGSVSTLWRFAR
jgi:Ca2+:H+ antiporter